MSIIDAMPMDMYTCNSNNMHTSFYWGRKAILLFPNWPHKSLHSYVLALLLVFLAAAAVELLSVATAANKAAGSVAAYSQAFFYALRVALSFMVMLSLMSFNVGVLIAAIAGHTIGFFAVKVATTRRSRNELKDEDQTPSLEY